MDGFRVAVKHRNPDCGRIHLDTVIAHDLTGLPNHLHFFLRVAVFQENINVRQHIERNLLGVYRRLYRPPVEQLGGLGCQFLNRLLARPGYGLIGTDVDTFNADGIVNRLQDDKHLNSGAIRIRDDAARSYSAIFSGLTSGTTSGISSS